MPKCKCDIRYEIKRKLCETIK